MGDRGREHIKWQRLLVYIMWGICDVCTLALTVAKTSSHYDRFAISVPARSLLLFDLNLFLRSQKSHKMLPKRLSPAVKTFRHQRRFGNKKLPKRLPPSCCRNVLCRNVRNPHLEGIRHKFRSTTRLHPCSLPFQPAH